MADTSEPEDALGAQMALLVESAARIRELNERLINFAVAEGSRTLDTYERVLTNLVEDTEKAGATQLGGWRPWLRRMLTSSAT